jgi:hypothetical protein
MTTEMENIKVYMATTLNDFSGSMATKAQILGINMVILNIYKILTIFVQADFLQV